MKKITKLVRIEHQKKFTSINEALIEANAIKISAERIAKKNNYSCKLLIGVSEHDVRSYKKIIELNGNRGRPCVKFVPKNTNKRRKVTKPHLHMIMCANPAETMANKIVETINKRNRRKNIKTKKQVVARRYPVHGGNKYIGYVIEQSTYLRTVNNDPDGLLNDFDFNEAYQKIKPEVF